MIDILVKYVPLPGRVTHLADGVFDLLERQVMHRARGGDDVFLDHQAAHVVRAEEQCELAYLQALRHPRGLDVRDVVEIEPGDGLRPEVFERTGRRDVPQVGVLRLQRPADEGGEAVGFVLQLPQAVQGFDALGQGFYVAEHHGGGGTAAELVPDAVDLEPFVGQALIDGDGLADAIDQDLAAAPRQAPHAGGHQTLEHLAQGELVEFVEVPDSGFSGRAANPRTIPA